MRSFVLLGLAIMSSTSFADGINNTSDAFAAGQEFANAGKNTAQSLVNESTGSQQLPNYGTTAPESANFQGGKNLIGVVGTNKQVQCESYKATTAYQQQECDAVNYLSKTPTTRPKYTIDKTNDPIMTGSTSIISNPGTVPGASNQQCRVETVTTPGTFIEETCTESVALETVSCKRGFSANVGTVVETKTFDVNRGSSVAPWSAQTFTMNFSVDGDPSGFILTRYQVDNYGQLWVNGTKVYQNILSGYSDMRGGSVKSTGRNSFAFYNKNGSSMGTFYDDGCNAGCSGVSPNLDITKYIKEGDNEIVLVCANANEIGPCAIKIIGTSKKLVLLGSLIDNQCSTLEQRAK